METITCKVKLFGAFRQFGDGSLVNVVLPKGANLRDLRAGFVSALKESSAGFKDDALVMESAFGNDDRILDENDVFDSDQVLAILPPVCGG